MSSLTIRRAGGFGKLEVWEDQGEIYIRESTNRGRDVAIVVLDPREFSKVAAFIAQLKARAGLKP